MPRPEGRPPFEPTPEQRKLVQVLAANGNPQAVIARNVGPHGIDEKTLRKYFADELANGHGQVVASLSAALVKAGMAGNVHAIKYWLATHGGPEWRMTERREIGGIEGALPIAVSGEAKVVVYLPDNGRDRPEPDQ